MNSSSHCSPGKSSVHDPLIENSIAATMKTTISKAKTIF